MINPTEASYAIRIGAPRPMASTRLAGLRVWPVPHFERWLIYYVPTETAVHIIRIRHSARDVSTLLEQ